MEIQSERVKYEWDLAMALSYATKAYRLLVSTYPFPYTRSQLYSMLDV